MKFIEKEKIKKAIVLIHNASRYYQGMDILCKMVGWPTIRNYFLSKEERAEVEREINRWINSQKCRRFARAGLMACLLFISGAMFEHVTYWFFTSEDVIIGWDASTGATRYKYRVEHLERGVVFVSGETTLTEVTVTLNKAGHYVFYVTACDDTECANDGQGNEVYSASTDPTVAMVNGQPRSWWIYKVLDPPTGIEFGGG